MMKSFNREIKVINNSREHSHNKHALDVYIIYIYIYI